MDNTERTLYGVPLSEINNKTEYEHGVYIETDTYVFYVPEEVSDSTSAVIYYPGSGGYNPDANPIRSVIENQAPNQVIVIAKSAYEEPEVASNKYVQLVNNIASAESIEINDIQNYGFSAGGRNAIQGIVNTIKINPDLPPQKAVIIDAGYNCSGCYLSEEQINVLKENEASILFFEEKNGGTSSYNVINLAKAGVDVIVAWAGSGHGGHVQINQEVFANDIMNYASGYTDTLLNADIYTFRAWDSEKQEWYEIPLEEVMERFVGEVVDLSDPFKYYEKLSSIEPLQSSNSFLGDKINSLRMSIRNTNFLNANIAVGFESTTNIPSAEDEIVQSFFTTCSALLNLLEKDTASIIEIGNSIEDMNAQLTVDANELNVSTDVVTDNKPIQTTEDVYTDNSSITDSYITSTPNYTNPSSDNNNSNNTTSTVTTPSTNGSINNSNTTNSGNNGSNYSPGISVPSSGGVSSSNNSSNSDNSSNIAALTALISGISKDLVGLEETIEEKIDTVIKYDDETTISDEILESFEDYEKLYSDDNMLVFQDKDTNYKVVIHHEDGKVVGLEYYYDLGDAKTADDAVEMMEKDFTDLESIAQKDQYVKLTFKDDLYKDLSLDDLKQVYASFNELKKVEV